MRKVDGWAWTALVASAVFALAATLAAVSVSSLERQIYDEVTAALPKTDVTRWITHLGSGTIIVPATVLLVSLLPREFLRRWWLWLAVTAVASAVELLGKGLVGRSRPGRLSAGFPSGHTEAAAVFYMMAAYFAATALKRRWARFVVYGLAAAMVTLVGLSRIALRVHWPLDVLGGAALGVAVVAGAAWWHERQRANAHRPAHVARAWLYRWQTVIPLPFLAVLILAPPMAEDGSALDVFFDISGPGFIVCGILLRLWAVRYAGKQAVFPRVLPTTLVSSGPYAHMRHPLAIGNFLIGVGIMLLAESGPGLLLIPGVLILIYRVTLPFEEAGLSEQLGRPYRDYCDRVPRLPRLTPSVVRAAFRMPSWRCLTADAPAIATALLFAVLAEVSESMQHLFR